MSHDEIRGVLGTEIVYDVEPGAVEGDWSVEVFQPDGERSFVGRLRAIVVGSCLILNWNGSDPRDDQKLQVAGIGRVINPDLIVASFEKVEPVARSPDA